MDGTENGTVTAPAAFVTLRDVSRRFGDVQAVRSVCLEIRRGEIFALLGPSGCGKSTLLRLLAGLETPSTGEITIEGRSIVELPPYRRPVNMMFQSYALFPHMTVEQNVAFGLRQERLPKREIAARTDRMLALVQMESMRHRKPHQLSGGQQQRVALARSLAKEPKLLLLDEPMAALDRKLRAEMQFELAEIIRRVRVTCVMVTHDQDEAMVMADRLALMNEGRVIQVGPPAEVYELPNSRFSASFLGAVNLFDGQVSASSEGLAVLDVPDLGGPVKVFTGQVLRPGSPACVAVRPEKIRLAGIAQEPVPNSAPAVVEDAGFLGSHTTYHLRLESGRLVTAMLANQVGVPRLGHGEPLRLSWDIRDGVLLTA